MNDTNQVAVDVMTVTPEIALGWLASNKYIIDDVAVQRPARPALVRFYADEMRKGEFHSGTLIEFGAVKDKKYLIDGQHRLLAVVESGASQVFLVKSVRYRNENELADAYARIDQGLKRTPADQFRAWQLASLYQITPTWLNKFSAAVKLINGKFSQSMYGKIHPSELVSLMDDYASAMLHYTELYSGPDVMEKPMQRSPVVAVALVTLKYSVKQHGSDKVDDFWFGVMRDDGLRSHDARKKAREFLLTFRMRGGTSKSYTTAAYASRMLAYMFNAFVKGDDVKYMPYKYINDNVSKPINISGYPLSGK